MIRRLKCIAVALLLACLFTLLSTSNVRAEETKSFAIIAWNVESPGSNHEVITKQLDTLPPFDILALSEVPESSAELFSQKWGAESSLLGTSGGQSRLFLTWNPNLFEVVKKDELKTIDDKGFGPGNQIAPLVVQLKHKSTGFDFNVVMNKLHRGSDVVRKTQAILFAEWGKKQTIPSIAVGGYNFDYDFKTKKGNAAFDAFLESKTWKWIEPKQWIDNNWADNDRDGKDDYPDSLLDFTFVTQWDKATTSVDITSEVIQRDGDFPDSDQTSDFRPMRTEILFKK